MARPKKPIDVEQVKKLSRMGCSYEEIAAVIGCGVTTLQRRFGQVVKDGHLNRNCSLRRKQYCIAMKGNTNMLVWLGKQYLGQKDQLATDHAGTVEVKVVYEDLPIETDSYAKYVEYINGNGTQEKTLNGNGHTNGHTNGHDSSAIPFWGN